MPPLQAQQLGCAVAGTHPLLPGSYLVFQYSCSLMTTYLVLDECGRWGDLRYDQLVGPSETVSASTRVSRR